MNAEINPRSTHAIRMPLTTALWAVSIVGWLLLLLTDQAPHTRAAYLAAALLAAIGAIARIIIASLRRDMARFTETLERSNDVNAELADAATAAAFREHADGGACRTYPLTDLEDLRPGGWGSDSYYDCVRQQVRPLGDTPNVVPLRARHKNVS